VAYQFSHSGATRPRSLWGRADPTTCRKSEPYAFDNVVLRKVRRRDDVAQVQDEFEAIEHPGQHAGSPANQMRSRRLTR